MTELANLPFTLTALATAYAGGLSPEAVVAEAFARLERAEDPAMFLATDKAAALAAARALGAHDPTLPLWGIPFAVKDNIDVAGLPTTAACPAWEHRPERDATLIARLRAAGAIVIGKTNLDQFATGLVGLRSPYGVPRNSLDAEIVPGGSSSGSGVAVARGIVSFALGTDTAGSGRVPAALNNIVGLKPTLGAWSARGVLPACRSVETPSVFALTVADAHAVHRVATGFDPDEPFSRRVTAGPIPAFPPRARIGIPSVESIVFDGDSVQEASFSAALDVLRAQGVEIVEIDFAPFYEVARLLYDGPWVAERLTVIEDLLARDPEAILPVTRAIVGKADGMSAADAFRGLYRLRALARSTETAMEGLTALCVPSIPRFVKTAELEADPVGPNALLGTYTNFVNLLDMAALAVPCGPRGDGRPGSVTLIGPAGSDALLAALAGPLEAAGERGLGATGWPRPAPAARPTLPAGHMEIVVCGAHMAGLPLNHQLTDRRGVFLEATRSAPDYRFFALAGSPPRPGMVKTAPAAGAAIAVEVWALPEDQVGSFLAGIPAPLGLGKVRLASGREATGFICEAEGAAGAEEITALADWRAWLGRQG